mgnify:CR=1 FL=1
MATKSKNGTKTPEKTPTIEWNGPSASLKKATKESGSGAWNLGYTLEVDLRNCSNASAAYRWVSTNGGPSEDQARQYHNAAKVAYALNRKRYATKNQVMNAASPSVFLQYVGAYAATLKDDAKLQQLGIDVKEGKVKTPSKRKDPKNPSKKDPKKSNPSKGISENEVVEYLKKADNAEAMVFLQTLNARLTSNINGGHALTKNQVKDYQLSCHNTVKAQVVARPNSVNAATRNAYKEAV